MATSCQLLTEKSFRRTRLMAALLYLINCLSLFISISALPAALFTTSPKTRIAPDFVLSNCTSPGDRMMTTPSQFKWPVSNTRFCVGPGLSMMSTPAPLTVAFQLTVELLLITVILGAAAVPQVYVVLEERAVPVRVWSAMGIVALIKLSQ